MAFFGNNTNPTQGAMEYLNQIPGLAHQYGDSYIQQGQQAERGIPDLYNQMATDPGAYLRNAQSQYQISPGYNQKYEQMMRAATAAANQSGSLGTDFDQQHRAALTQGLLGDDMQQWMQNYLQAGQTGLGGAERYGSRGFNESNDQYNELVNNLHAQGGLAYQDAENKNNQFNQMMKTLFKLGGAGAGAYFGGEGGRMAGAKIGSELGGTLFE